MESSDVIPRPITRRPLVPDPPDAERGDDPERDDEPDAPDALRELLERGEPAALREPPVPPLLDLLLELPEDLLEFPDDLLELPRPPLAPIPPLLPFGM